MTSPFPTEQVAPAPQKQVGGVAVERLRSIIERVENLEKEKSNIAADIRDIFSEAKSAGFDVKALKQIIKIRKEEPAELEQQEHILDTYRHALGL